MILTETRRDESQHICGILEHGATGRHRAHSRCQCGQSRGAARQSVRLQEHLHIVHKNICTPLLRLLALLQDFRTVLSDESTHGSRMNIIFLRAEFLTFLQYKSRVEKGHMPNRFYVVSEVIMSVPLLLLAWFRMAFVIEALWATLRAFLACSLALFSLQHAIGTA